jgi:2-oxoglutarate ferredoxin oxidoreductase subunit gamma
MIRPGGLLFINSSLIDVVSGRTDITEILIPCNDIAIKAGSPRAVNMVMLAAYVAKTEVVSFETIRSMMENKMSGKKELLEINHRALEEGRRAVVKSAVSR